MWGSSRCRARRCSSSPASSRPARTSARSAATAAPPILAENTRRTPVTVPWTRTRPATEATRWKLPASDAASRSRSATSRTRPAASASWLGVIACWPITASLVVPACPTVTVPSGQHPSSHGRPAGWLSSWVAWARSAAPTGRADSWSSRTTNQDGTAPKLANLTVGRHLPGKRKSGWRFHSAPPGPWDRTQSDCFLVTASFGPVPPIPVIFLNEPAAVSVGRSYGRIATSFRKRSPVSPT